MTAAPSKCEMPANIKCPLCEATWNCATLSAADAEIGRLKEQVAKVLEGFDRKIFVRNIEGDGASDWAVKCFPYLRALGILAESLPLAATEEK